MEEKRGKVREGAETSGKWSEFLETLAYDELCGSRAANMSLMSSEEAGLNICQKLPVITADSRAVMSTF